jgi:hypothetical protein
MTLEGLISKYIAAAERVLRTIEITEACMVPDRKKIEKIVESARAYFEDAKHYKNKRKLDVSLTSIAYCEGLLDSLRLLGVVKFEWPAVKTERKE